MYIGQRWTVLSYIGLIFMYLFFFITNTLLNFINIFQMFYKKIEKDFTSSTASG